MKRILLSILLAIAATGAQAQFKANINIKPDYDETPRSIRFNFAEVCRQLGTGYDKFAHEMNLFTDVSERNFKLYLLTDTYHEWVSGSGLSLDGKTVEEWDEIKWLCDIRLYGMETNVLEFTISKWIDPFTRRLTVKEGDVGHAVWALEYDGGMATFDITVNFTEEKESGVLLSSLEKVGEQVLSAKYTDYRDRLMVGTDLTEIAEKFGEDVKWANLELYAMKDPRRQLLCNYSTTDIKHVFLYIDGTACENLRNDNWINLAIDSGKALTVGIDNAEKLGGQTTSGSVFLVSGNKYYELILDIQFDRLFDDLERLDVVETETMDVQLMQTDNFFTFYDREEGRYALVSTEIDEEHVRGVLGTQTPFLFTEKKDDGGRILLTRRYSAAPGQGFWFASEDGQCYFSDGFQFDTPLGLYYTEGSLKWYEGPDFVVRPGNKYRLNLYLANSDNGKAVKYEINVEIVKELQIGSVAYVRSLPASLTGGTPDGIERPTPSPSRNGGEVYDLQGRRLQKAPEKGLYIQGGKKVLVK